MWGKNAILENVGIWVLEVFACTYDRQTDIHS